MKEKGWIKETERLRKNLSKNGIKRVRNNIQETRWREAIEIPGKRVEREVRKNNSNLIPQITCSILLSFILHIT